MQRIDPDYVPVLSDLTLQWVEYGFTFFFTLELFIRVFEQGLLFTKNAYLKNGWNIMDTLILVFSWIDFASYFLGLDNAGKLIRKIHI